MRLPIIIPSLEPDHRLVELCQNLMEAGLNDIVVVNDGSDASYQPIFDKVSNIIQKPILVHSVNKGKGAALKTAFTHLLQDDEVMGCITADSDGQHTPKDIRRLMEEFKQNSGSLVLGVRDFNQENVPFRNRFGNKLSIQLFSLLAGVKVSDTQTGLRAIPRDFMKELLEVKENRFEFETKMLLLSKGKYPIHEITIETVYEEKENYVTHYNPVKDSMRIFMILIKQFVYFIFSSLSSSIVDIAFFTLFCHMLKSTRTIYYVTLATVFARIISAIYNYSINYFLVFKSKSDKASSFKKYVILAIVQMTCSATLITLCVRVLGDGHTTILKIFVDTILFFISYNIQKKYVF